MGLLADDGCVAKPHLSKRGPFAYINSQEQDIENLRAIRLLYLGAVEILELVFKEFGEIREFHAIPLRDDLRGARAVATSVALPPRV